MDAGFEESRMISNRSINFQLDADLDWLSRRILVGFGFAPLCLIFKFQGMSRRWMETFPLLQAFVPSIHKHPIHLKRRTIGYCTFIWATLSEGFALCSVDSRKNYTFNYFPRACSRLKWKKKKKLAMITKVFSVQ